MLFDMGKFLDCLSLVLDFSVYNYLQVNLNHSKRVAYVSLCMGKEFDMNIEDIKRLYAFALLHDNGLTLAETKLTINKKTHKNKIRHEHHGLKFIEETFKRTELLPEHSLEGEKNILSLPIFSGHKNVIKYHHENHDGSGPFKIDGDSIPLFSQIIHLADELDINFNIYELDGTLKNKMIKYVDKNNGKLFSPRCVEAFLSFRDKERFWYDLSFFNISEVLERVTPKMIYDYTWDDILEVSKTFMKIIDSKSRFTFRHSMGIAEKILIMSDYYGYDEVKKKKLHIAANLHDLGKLYVQNAIIDKPARLSSQEYNEMKKHAYFTRLILEKVPFFEEISVWASNHHEKLNGHGYPDNLGEGDIDFESRLLGIVDIYQALTEERPYRSAMLHEEAMSIIYGMSKEHLLDNKIAKDVDKVISKTLNISTV